MLSMDIGEAAARARAGAVLPRIQLHDPAGLRLRRAGPALRLHPADGRLGPVGQHRQRHRPRPPHGHAAALCPRPARCSPPASGAKMGKTAAGAVWLNADMLAPYDYWQFWRNTEDARRRAASCRLFTTLPLDEIARLEALRGRRDQRGQEGARDRGDRAAARPRGRRAGGRDGAQDLRAGRAGGESADRGGRRGRCSRPGSAC